MTGTRNTNAEVELRRRAVFKLVVNGYNREEIRQFLAEKHRKTGKDFWNVSERNLYRDIKKCEADLEDYAIIHRIKEVGRARSRLDNLYQRALNAQDLKTALAIERTRIDLFKLNEVTADDADKKIDDLIAALQGKITEFRTKKKESKIRTDEEDELDE